MKNSTGTLGLVSEMDGMHRRRRGVRGTQGACEEEPPDYANGDVCNNLAPDHVDVGGAEGVAVAACLLDGLPYCQEAKAEGEASGRGSELVVSNGSRHYGVIGLAGVVEALGCSARRVGRWW